MNPFVMHGHTGIHHYHLGECTFLLGTIINLILSYDEILVSIQNANLKSLDKS